MIQATAPGRCGIIGNPTDLYGGSVVSCTTAERAKCTLEVTGRNIILEVSGDRQVLTKREDLSLVGDRLDLARAVLTMLEIVPGESAPFMLTATTDIPMHASLAGSSALVTAIAACVVSHRRLTLNKYQFAELVRKIEDEVLQSVSGLQDHYMTTFGGLNYLDFRGKNSSDRHNAASPFATVEPLSAYIGKLPLLIAHTTVKNHTINGQKSLRDRWLEVDPEAIDGFSRIEILARLGKRALLSSDWSSLADLMTENHAIVRNLGGSCDACEILIRAAHDGGAIGANLAGDGKGGTIVVLTMTPETTVKHLVDAGADTILYPVPSPGLAVTANASAVPETL